MSTILRIEVETVEALSGEIQGIHGNEIKEVLGRLRQINDRLDQAWDGPAQVTFTERYGDWIMQLENFSDTLVSVNKYLTSVAQNYRELDEAAKAAAAGAVD